jgi:hypothetical protein
MEPLSDPDQDGSEPHEAQQQAAEPAGNAADIPVSAALTVGRSEKLKKRKGLFNSISNRVFGSPKQTQKACLEKGSQCRRSICRNAIHLGPVRGIPRHERSRGRGGISARRPHP